MPAQLSLMKKKMHKKCSPSTCDDYNLSSARDREVLVGARCVCGASKMREEMRIQQSFTLYPFFGKSHYKIKDSSVNLGFKPNNR